MLQRIGMVAGLLLAGAASGQSLRLSYTVEDVGGGMYLYNFTLTPCDGFEPGMAWRGLIWGDCDSCPTPLTDFQGDMMSLPVGPWTEFTTISGDHNGPMFGDPELWWTPGVDPFMLRWAGLSTAELGPGELLFSALEGQGGASAVAYKPAIRRGTCYPDCDGSGDLDFFDFLCFQNAFATGDPWADCDGCGSLDFFDFLCFMDAFGRGCE